MAIKDLYEELGAIEYMIVESFGEITPEIEERTVQIQSEVTKVVSWAIPKIKEHEGMVKIKKDYAKEVLDSAKYHENKALGLKALIDNLMVASELNNIETPEGKVLYRKSTSVAIDDETMIPDDYFKVEEVRKLDKKALKEVLKTENVEGVHLEESQNIQIRG